MAKTLNGQEAIRLIGITDPSTQYNTIKAQQLIKKSYNDSFVTLYLYHDGASNRFGYTTEITAPQGGLYGTCITVTDVSNNTFYQRPENKNNNYYFGEISNLEQRFKTCIYGDKEIGGTINDETLTQQDFTENLLKQGYNFFVFSYFVGSRETHTNGAFDLIWLTQIDVSDGNSEDTTRYYLDGEKFKIEKPYLKGWDFLGIEGDDNKYWEKHYEKENCLQFVKVDEEVLKIPKENEDMAFFQWRDAQNQPVPAIADYYIWKTDSNGLYFEGISKNEDGKWYRLSREEVYATQSGKINANGKILLKGKGWEKRKISVNFNANGGYFTLGDEEAEKLWKDKFFYWDDKYEKNFPNFPDVYRPGCNFLGWYHSTSKVYPEHYLKSEYNHTLKAKWESDGSGNVKIYVDNKGWVAAIPYVYVDNRGWVAAVPYVYADNKWQLST